MFSLYLSGDRSSDDKAVLDYLALTIGECDDILELYSSLSNASALLKWYIPRVNWLGFYIARGQELVLGPFQGDPACTHIPFSKGVCGKCARDKRSVVVDDVELFPGHIACSSLSKSEVVVPILYNGEVVAVLDTDSPEKNRFKEEDVSFLQMSCDIISSSPISKLLKEIGERG